MWATPLTASTPTMCQMTYLIYIAGYIPPTQYPVRFRFTLGTKWLIQVSSHQT